MLVVVRCGNDKVRTMSDNKTQPGVRVNEQLWKQFRQEVQEQKGAINGHLSNEVEAALSEYLNASDGGDTHDRLTNIETELSDVRALLESEVQTKKDSGLSSTTEKRLRKIKEQIDDETDGSPKVHNEVVELAIRQNAGSSKPTIQRYKELLREDDILYEHPANDAMYFRESTDFVQAVNALAKGGKIRQSDYNDILESYGEDWWREQLPNDTDTSERGFE